MKYLAYSIAIVISVVLLVAPHYHWTKEFGLFEAVGFVAGAWGVWLTVKENVWNWPIGIANEIAYIVVFWKARLFADMGLQWVFLVLSIAGWYLWLYGGEHKTRLVVTRIQPLMTTLLTVLTLAFTVGMTIFLRSVNDAAPFWDALTTGMSLSAQFMLTRKNFENWHVWLAADIIYVGLYINKHLYLTAILYAVFCVMCLFGMRDWRKSMERNPKTPAGLEAEGVWPPSPQHPLA